MRTIVLITCYLSGLFLLPSCGRNEMPDPDTVITWGHIENVEVYSTSLEGNLLGDPADRGVNVYLPKSYYTNPDKRFPVIYYLHGLPASEHSLINPEMGSFMSDYPQKQFISWINQLIDYGGMKETIVVMPNAANHYGVSFYTNNQVQGNYEDYIVDDLVFYMDMNFKTIPHSNYRAITGHSAGGYGALRIAMRHPDVFQYVAGLSPILFTHELVMNLAELMIYEDTTHSKFSVKKGPLWGFKGPSDYRPWTVFKFANNYLYSGAAAWLPNSKNPPFYVDIPFTYNEDGQVVMNDEQLAKWASESLFNLVLNNSNGLKELKSIYFDCGQHDSFMWVSLFSVVYDEFWFTYTDHLKMYPSNLALHEMLDEMKIKHRFESYEGTHYSNLYERLGKVLVDLSNDFPKYD